METRDDTRKDALSRRIAALSPAKRALLAQSLKSKRARVSDDIPRNAGRISSPLSFAQQRLWFLDRFEGRSAAYHMPGAIRLRGDLNRAALEQALRALAARHESLRTRFVDVDGEPVQKVDPDLPPTLRVEDLGTLTGAAQEGALAAALRRERGSPFDLSQGPLLRTTLLELGPREHVLTWTFHHIISDGWSVGVFKRELAALYEAFCNGRSSPLEPLPIQYADYAVWQRQRLQGETLKQLLAYWTRKLEGAPPLLALPTDRPRTSQPGHPAGESRRLDLPPELAASVSALCQREGVTLFMALLGAFNVLLTRWSGQEDIVIGTPMAGRDRLELEGVIGFFINTVALRTDLSGNATFEELLTRVRTTALEAFEHQDLPFEKLLEELRVERDLSHSPVFQVFFNMPNMEAVTVSFPGLEVERVPLPEPEAKFDLTLYAVETGGTIRLRAVYKSDLFHGDTIERMLDQYVYLLKQVTSAPETPIGDYSLITASARARLPDPTIPIDAPAQQSVVAQVLARANAAPDRIAVRAAGQQWTYAELTGRAGSLATTLQGMGVRRGDVVAIVGPRGFGLIGAMLGVLMSGGAFLTIDPALPARRKRVMLAEARAKVVCLIGQPGDSERDLEVGDTLAVLRADLDLTSHVGPEGCPEQAWPLPAIHGDDPAYVFFTSGSTGQPKAILGCHKGLSHFLQWQRGTFAIGAEDRVSQLIGLTFDPLLRDVFLPLTSGATLCVPADSDLLDTIGWMQREGVTVVHTTPTVMQSWLLDRQQQLDLPSLRWLFVAGEPLTDVLIGKWRRAISSPAQLVNLYGPTETTMARCFYTIPAEVTPGVQPIGVPLPDSQALVLNANGVLCGIGEIGEIVLRTPFRSLGYLNLPEETARRFRPNPFRDDASDLLYFTGDLGRYRANGLLEIAGRVDDQVKIRGVRIDPGEVTATLARHEAVRHCVVVGRDDMHGQPQLIGYVVPEPGKRVDATELRVYLTGQLPQAFVPGTFVFLDALPVLPNGKIDRRALPAPQFGREALGRTCVPPRDALEEVIAGVWREVLQVEQVGVHDNFFEVGGHSLLATQVVARLARLLQVEVPLRDFFESPTVSALAAGAHKRLGAGEPRAAAPMEPVPRGGDLPLSFAQQRLWFLDRLRPAQNTYNMPAAWRLQGPLEVAALTRSLAVVVARHETLRTRIVLRDGAPVQVIDPAQPVALPLTDLSTLPPAAREARARPIAETEARQPFDLAAGPLLRAQLLRLAADEHWLLLTVHHIASDGWSVGVLQRELAAAYAAFVQGTAPEWPALPIQYADYAVGQRAWLQGSVLEEQLGYWKHQLGDLSPLELPTDRPRPPVASHQGAHLAVDLPAPLSGALMALGRGEGATLFMTLLAAFQVLLSRYSGQADMAVGTPIAGRGRTELEGLIGFFVNTLVLRADLSGNPRFRELLARVRDTALGAYTHQDLPFEKLVEELAPARDLSRSPLFQVLFVLQNAPGAGLALDGVEVSRLPLEGHSAKFDLTVSVRESAAGLRLSWEYATDLFDAATIARMAGHFQVLLEAIVADPEQRIGELPLLTEAERHQLLVAWNDTAADYPRDRCIHQLFEAQAARTPEAVAVVCEDRHLTYAKLNARANQLAHHLIALGVGPEVLVGICMERSLELIVGLLGILKAGGAYVPLDPSYPPARLAFMLADTHAPVLLTQEGLLGQLPPFDGHVLCLDRDWPMIAAQPDTDPPCRATAETLAYVIYTSGSTGTPKGVAIEHRSTLTFLQWAAGVFSDQELAGTLFSTSICFDLSVFELFAPLSRGGAVIVAEHALQLPALPGAGRVTLINTVPSAMTELLRMHGVPASVRTVNLAGEPLPGSLARGISALTHVEKLYNLYGPTEATTYSTFTLIARGDTEAPTIGRPIANTDIYIVDANLQPVPIGVTGELYIGGDGLARGYLNRPELTPEKFVPDPFAAVPGARLYRTGDLARYRPDGHIEFLGRLDAQVKIRGFRIEPGEIEAVLGEHPAVRETVVVAREDTPGDQRLVAYVVPADGSWADVEALRALLRERLPEYLRPAAYVLLQRLPLSPNGKVDRRSLPAPQFGRGEAGDTFVAPRNSIEDLVAEVWCEVLKMDRVGVHDNFFELGGHSLLAAQVLARLAKRLKFELPLRRMFEAPTIAELAEALVRVDRGPDEAALERILREVEALTDEETAQQLDGNWRTGNSG